MTSDSAGTLFLVGTPIGNLGDITVRALDTLRSADAIVCEDTRRTWKLLSHYDIPRPRIVFAVHDHNERKVVPRVLGLLREGCRVALTSDAGMPMVSDPGYLVATEARADGHRVEIIPGPSAVSTALLASGMPVHAFDFRGFPPRKPGKRRKFFEAAVDSEATLIAYVSPHRVGKVLAAAAEVLGDRDAALCIELTKKFEQVERGTVAELAERIAADPPKGELTLVIAGLQRKDR